MASCGPPLRRLPSLVGSDAAALSEYLPPIESRVRVKRQVEEAIGEIEASSDPVVVLLVAEWGEGKTSIFNAMIKPEAERRNWVVLEARTASLLAHLRALSGRVEKSPAHRFLAALLAAALEHAGMLREYGTPESAPSLRDYIVSVVGRLSSGRKMVIFLDEFEDIVTVRDQELVGEIVAGLLGLINGDVEEFSARCRLGECLSGVLHLVLSLTPPAYTRLVSLRDFATIAARLKRRIRAIWIPPLSHAEALLFLQALAKYSLGSGVDGLLNPPSISNSLVQASLGNLGALVSLYRYIASRAWEAGRDKCGGVSRLDAQSLLAEMTSVKLSIGGAEFPALNTEVYRRLVESWMARAKIAGFNPEHARRLLDELVASILVYEEEAAVGLRLDPRVLASMVDELNLLGESWPRRELGVSRLVYRVDVSTSVEEAYKLAADAAPEVYKVLPQLRSEENSVEKIVDSLVYMDSRGYIVVALPSEPESLVDLVSDASPVELSRAEAERLADILWNRVFTRLERSGRALLLSPRLTRTLYVSPELRYLDFISDRVERFQYTRRAYVEARPLHLLIGLSLVLAGQKLLAQPPLYQSENTARAVIRLPGVSSDVRVLVYTVLGELTSTEARGVESQVTTALLSGWRPHAVLIVYYGGVEPSVLERLEQLERRLFVKIVLVPIEALVTRVKLTVLGLKLLEATGSVEEALVAAVEAARDAEKASGLGLDPYRLGLLVREVGDELDITHRLRRGLEEGVEGAPIIIGDPQLGYDVEKPTELAGALRYYLASLTTRTTPRQALTTAYEYVMRYHLYRHGGGEARGLLSPDIDRREVTVLERYTALLVANRMLERLNGELRVDVLSPMERSVVKALEQLGARSEPVPAAMVWQALVVNTQNPGTKRMLIQLLVNRGLVEASSRRVDAERTRLRLLSSEDDAVELIRRAREVLERLRNTPEAMTWGYIVSAKARDFRAGTLEAFTEKARLLLDRAEEALKAGNLLMALRLSRLVNDLVDYVVDEILEEHVKPVAKSVARLREELAELHGRVVELREAAETVLNNYVFRDRIRLVAGIEERLQKALEAIDEVEKSRLTEQELEEAVKKLWEEAARSQPREPGKKLPFYIGGLGPKLHFNYKYWLLLRRLEEHGVGRLGDDGVRVAEDIVEAVNRLEEIVAEVRAAVEAASAARAKTARLRRILEDLGIQPPPLEIVVSRIPAPADSLSLDKAYTMVMQWKASLLGMEKPLDQALAIAEKLAAARKDAEEAMSRAREQLARLREQVEALEAHQLHELAGKVREATVDLATAIQQAQRLLEPPGIDAGELAAIVGSLEEYYERVLSAKTILLDAIAAAKRIESDVREAISRRIEHLYVEVHALARVLGVEPPQPASDPVEAYARLRMELESLMREITGRGVLGEEELQAYLAIVEEKQRRQELLLREAVAKVSEKLGVDEAKARKLIIGLIERGVIEPRI